MGFADGLRKSSRENNSIVCMGMDPVLEKIPLQGGAEEKIVNFYSGIFDACVSASVFPAAVKPNYAFYAQYGFEGLRALKKVIEKAKSLKLPVILDAKRGDIGKTAVAYATECFNFWQADAVTVSPYLGGDSLQPFVKWCAEKGKGIYILNRTSNAGAKDLQNLEIGDKKLYSVVAEKIAGWGKNAEGGVGAVVGATSMQELEEIASFYVSQNPPVPLLIPGVGAQGGSAKEVADALKKTGYDLGIVRINSSSGINYAFEKQGTDDFAGAAVNEIKKLNAETGM